MMENYWIHNREVILQQGKIITDPVVDKKLEYHGKSIKAEIKENTIDTLIKAGLFKKPKNKVYRNPVYFVDGLSSVRSDWDRIEDCFASGSDGVSDWYSISVPAFEKTKPLEIEK